jgi:restriction system protein
VLVEKPPAINVKFLRRLPSYSDFIGKSAPTQEEGFAQRETAPVVERRIPLELIDSAHKSLRQATTEDLLSTLKACSPAFFEAVVASDGDGIWRRGSSRNGDEQAG